MHQQALLVEKNAQLDKALNMCTEEQQLDFGIRFPGGVPANKVDEAYKICAKALDRNKRAVWAVEGIEI